MATDRFASAAYVLLELMKSGVVEPLDVANVMTDEPGEQTWPEGARIAVEVNLKAREVTLRSWP